MATVRALGVLTALVLIGTTSVAHAQTAKPRAPVTTSFTVREDFDPKAGQFSPDGARKTIQWDAQKGRWGLKLDVEQPVARDPQRAVEAGAYYRVTPSLRVGGAVGVAPGAADALVRKSDPQEPAPRVRLETAFKF